MAARNGYLRLTSLEARTRSGSHNMFALGFLAGLALTVLLLPIAPKGGAAILEAANTRFQAR